MQSRAVIWSCAMPYKMAARTQARMILSDCIASILGQVTPPSCDMFVTQLVQKLNLGRCENAYHVAVSNSRILPSTRKVRLRSQECTKQNVPDSHESWDVRSNSPPPKTAQTQSTLSSRIREWPNRAITTVLSGLLICPQL